MLQSYKNESIEFIKSKVYTYDLRILCLNNEEATNDAYAQAQVYEKSFTKFLKNIMTNNILENKRIA
ncbi:MAG: hypothetical protein LBC44_01615 [Mycoplasmataceae bacterium]|jgi:hypothetical protein|nr:hypothetical protein [Mycoplasmataceae bacterium]